MQPDSTCPHDQPIKAVDRNGPDLSQTVVRGYRH